MAKVCNLQEKLWVICIVLSSHLSKNSLIPFHDKGGMWHLASMISSAVKSGKEGAESVLKLEAGAVREGEDVEAKGKLERRRKRTRGRR